MTEDTILNKVAVEQYLSGLDPESRMVLTLIFELDIPDDWGEDGAVTYAAVGRYVGRKFRKRPLSEAAIRYIRDMALAELSGMRRKSRKNRAK